MIVPTHLILEQRQTEGCEDVTAAGFAFSSLTGDVPIILLVAGISWSLFRITGLRITCVICFNRFLGSTYNRLKSVSLDRSPGYLFKKIHTLMVKHTQIHEPWLSANTDITHVCMSFVGSTLKEGLI